MATTDAATSTSTTMAAEHAPSASHIVNVGTRKSALARVQTDIVVDQLKQQWPATRYAIHAISTMGDKNQVTALPDFGAKSLWTHELEAMLLAGEVDFIVHSLKDIPTQLPPTLTIGAILQREDPRDALVLSPRLAASTPLAQLPAGSVIGTSSVRRSAQLARAHPHLAFQSVRGNVQTRLAKLDAADSPYAGIILAAAGLVRLGLEARVSRFLESGDGGMLHAVGQGAIGVQTREDDARVARLLAPLACRATTLACLAERSLLRTLEGGCSVPVGVETQWDAPESRLMYKAGPTGRGADQLTMRAVVVSLDGARAAEAVVTEPVVDEDMADVFGRKVAEVLLERGAGEILAEIIVNRDVIDKQTDNA